MNINHRITYNKLLLYCIRAEKTRFLTVVFVSLVNALSNALITVYMQKTIDSIIAYNAEMFYINLIVVAILSCVAIVTLSLNNGLNEIITLKCDYHVKNLIIDKCEKLDFEFFLDSNNNINIRKAMKSYEQIGVVIYSYINVMFFIFPYAISIGLYFYFIYKPSVLLVLTTVAAGYFSNKVKKKYTKNSINEELDVVSENSIIERYFIDYDYLKEIKAYGNSDWLFNKWLKTKETILNIVNRANKNNLVVDFLYEIFEIISYAILVVILCVLCVKQRITIGSLVSIIGNIGLLFIYSTEVFGYYINNINHKIMEIELLTDFLNTDEGISKRSINNDDTIELKNVFYKYPNSRKYAIKDISVKINQGERIAIVGDNGSGKTTFGLLVAGLIKPTKGMIKYGTYKNKNEISCLFQDFNKYKMTISDNITISDINKIDKKLEKKLFKQTEIDLKLSEVLSNEFSNENLSLGQWHKLALARSYYREGDLLILDEPNASIDVFEEEKMIDLLKTAFNSKKLILISHKLITCKNVDRILVFKNGEIVEEGTFGQLMKRKGLFYNIYKQQADRYLLL